MRLQLRPPILRCAAVAIAASTALGVPSLAAADPPDWCKGLPQASVDALKKDWKPAGSAMTTAQILDRALEIQRGSRNATSDNLVADSCQKSVEDSFVWLRRFKEGQDWAHKYDRGFQDTYFENLKKEFQRVELQFGGTAKPADLEISRANASFVLHPFLEADNGASYALWLDQGEWTLKWAGKQVTLEVDGDCPPIDLDRAAATDSVQCGSKQRPGPGPEIPTSPEIPTRLSLELAGEWSPKWSHAAGGTESVGGRVRLAGSASFLSFRGAVRFVPNLQGDSLGRANELVGAGFFFPFADILALGPFADVSIWDVGPVYVGGRAGLRFSVDALPSLTFVAECAGEGYPESGDYTQGDVTFGLGVAFNAGIK
jgi:hypothetical protein